jgi:ferredoxin
MELGGKTVLVCNCEGTMTLDGKALAKACGKTEAAYVNSQLCRAQIDNFRAALAGGKPLLVACTQEAPLFGEVKDATRPDAAIGYVNIRERAGWSAEGEAALPKIAALLAEAALDMPHTATVALKSQGVCLVYGRDEAAIEAAKQLAGRLDVTLLLSRPASVLPPRVMNVPIFKGTIAAAKGHLGAFEIVVNDYAPASPSARAHLAFDAARDGAASRCDLILDLSGAPALFPAPEKRDGYFRPDPKNPAAVQRALFEICDLVGEFDKPRYVAFDAAICAHSRSRKTGCTRCLDVCPASAISSAGDAVAIDPFLCGGCGACHSVCPTGAASYALPPPAALFQRLRALLGAYRAAGGRHPVVLVHDPRHGDELITLAARAGRGLPANVLPFVVNEVTQVGFDFLAVAFAYGAAQVRILVPPGKRGELAGLAGQIGLSESMMAGLGFGGGRVDLLLDTDPEALSAALYGAEKIAGPRAADFTPPSDKRSLIRAALLALHEVAPTPVEKIPLPPNAPFGAVLVDVAGCTVCLACVGACPTGALQDNPDAPQLRFQEDACVQCGLCKVTCPEKVIRLEPRLNFTAEASRAILFKEDAPFHCIRCNKAFGSKSTIDKIIGQLAGKHAMFQSPVAIQSMQMCDNCRVVARFEDKDPYFAGRELPRTSEDYFREREEEEKARAANPPGGNGKNLKN